jgi:hypothetical protein
LGNSWLNKLTIILTRMKFVSLLIISILLPCYLRALSLTDTIYPMLSDGMEWSITQHGSGPPPYPWQYTSYRQKVIGDSLLNGYIYKKVYTSLEEIPTSWYSVNLYRETTDGKVFQLFLGLGEDEIMFDFSLEVGDTITLWAPWFTGLPLHVLEKDSVIINGQYRDHLLLGWGSAWVVDEWIEGIGSLVYGPRSMPEILFGTVYELLCAHLNNVQLYQHPVFPYCYMNTVGVEEISTQNLALLPNPVEDVSVFQTNTAMNGPVVLEVYDVLGRLCKTSKEPGLADVQIRHSDFRPGVYSFRIRINQKEFSGKFINR